MKFYDCTTAPSPRRVRIFLAEKGITIPNIQVDLRNGEQFSPAFRAINPECTVPVLALDNGTRIADIVAICRYFEELYREPPLMGRTAEQKALIEAWQRRVERDGFYAAMEAFRNSTPGLKRRALPGAESYEQITALADRGRVRVQHFFAWLDARLGENEFVCGSQFTIADITGLVTVDFCGWAKLKPAEELTHLRRWHAAVSARPSAKA
jgi:glutathione S-transferase